MISFVLVNAWRLQSLPLEAVNQLVEPYGMQCFLALSMHVQNFMLLLITLRFPLRSDPKPVIRIRDCGLLVGLFEASPCLRIASATAECGTQVGLACRRPLGPARGYPATGR